MKLQFTRSDLVTFLLGALAAALVPLGASLAQLDSDPVTDYSTWAMGLATGIVAALGRYLVTAVPAARVLARPLPEPVASWDADMMRASLEATLNRPGPTPTNTVGELLDAKKRQPPAG